MFQSQTGSQALSDFAQWLDTSGAAKVSIPNGKPSPLRRDAVAGQLHHVHVSIPIGKPSPLRRASLRASTPTKSLFQSQTGSQALSDFTVQGFGANGAYVSIPNGK